jgi:acyl carrier protein
VEEAKARQALRAWVVHRGNVSDELLKDDSVLVSEGFINSLDVLDLIDTLETLRGRPVDTLALKGEEFRSIDSLIDSFFKGTV